MDIVQIFGDYIHLLGMIILLAKLWLTKDCAGISGKTQLLYAMVFTARYTDLTIRSASLYNTILKIVYIAITYCTVLSIFLFFRKTYDRKRDAFRIELLIIPSAVMGLFVNHRFETVDVFYAFSCYLEAVAIVPQVYLVSKSKQVESIAVSYIACLGLYRGCYLMHWLYAYVKNEGLENIAVGCGIVQLVLYCDFFARNLPILKPKNRTPIALSEEVAEVKEPTAELDKAKDVECSEQLVVRGCDVPCKDNIQVEAVISMPPRNIALDAEENVTLLATKEERTRTNSLRHEISS